MATIPTALMTHPPTPEWAKANAKAERDADARRGPPGPLRFDDGSDVLDRLPPRAQPKLKDIRREVEELNVLTQATLDNQQELIQDRMKSAARLAELTDPAAAARMGSGFTYSDDHPSVISARAEYDRLTAKLEAIEAIQKERSKRRTALGNLLHAVEDYLTRLPSDASLEVIETDPPVLEAGQRPALVVEAIRHRRRELLVDLRAVKTAPIPSSVAKAKVRTEIEAIAKRGEPDLYGSLEGGDSIRWPQVNHSFDIHAIVAAEGAPFVRGSAIGRVPDALAVDVWKNKDSWIARLEKLVDEIADDANALSDEERDERSADILDQVLTVERREEALTEMAGNDVIRRADLDPRAFLGVIGPAPKGDRR